jgi:aspartate/methionine/tyrosine aminotransferase
VRFSSAASVAPSQIRAIATLADNHPGTLRLFVGEDTRPTPDFIKQAAREAIEQNRTYYTPNAGYLEVRQALARHLLDLHEVDIDPQRELIVTSSGMNAILLGVQATLGPGSSALVVTPLWPNMASAIRVAGAEAIEVPLQFRPSGFDLDWSMLERQVRPDTRLLALASPGNPTGWTATSADWQRLYTFCERHDLWLMADSVYERIVFASRVAPSPLAIPEFRRRLILVNSLSKAYRMTGWRAGYVVGPPELARVMTGLQEFIVSNAPGVVQMAACAAVNAGEPEIAESQVRYAEHRRLVMDALCDQPGLALAEPTGGFYVFPRLDGLRNSLAFCEHMVRQHRLGLAPGSAFGAGGADHIRLCFAVERPILEEALDRFRTHWRSSLVAAAVEAEM